MKAILTLLLTFSLTFTFAQDDEFELLLANGKAEFNKEFDQQDYAAAVESLEKAVKLKPDNAEAHYFLGYAYSRLNSKDGKGMYEMNLPLTLKCSEQFEIVNRLSPLYTGESLILDPYSKLTSEWGSLAMTYWHASEPDSAMWAFKEGKKRGGFGEFYLSINRAVLDLCSQNAILISSGDNFTIPLWYLQVVESYRTDVSVIDISLLSTTWYPSYLSTKGFVQFDLPKATLDTIEYCQWHDTTITISNFSWTVKPSYYDNYIMRGDRVFLSLLKANKFKRDVYFTTGFMEDYRLSLKDYLLSMTLIDKLNTSNQAEIAWNTYITNITKILLLVKNVNPNSFQELNFIDMIRYDIFVHTAKALEKNEKQKAKELLALMDKYADETTYPWQTDNGKKYSEYIRGQF
jgi:tetratricopeptide (TPR) repeat protein